MKRAHWILWLLFLYGPILAQNDEVSVKLLNLPKQLKLGQRFTLIAEISSSKPMSQRVWMTVKLPQNWQVITKKVPSRIVGMTSARFVYTINIGRTAEAGLQEVNIVVFKNGLESFIERFDAQIEAIHNIVITASDPPEFVKEGETLRTQFYIQNLGNATEKLRLETSHGNIDNKGNNESIILKPNTSFNLTIVQVLQETDGQSWQAISDLKVTPIDSTFPPIYKAVSTPVFSSKTKPVDPYLRFPLEIGVWYSTVQRNNSNINGFQFDVRGRGYVDIEKKHHLDFVAHGPNQENIPLMGAFDQYTAIYTYDSSSVTLGDYPLFFSKLIELNRYGRGARFERQNNGHSYSIFYQKPRFYAGIKDIIGANYEFLRSRKHKVSINFLSKDLLFNNKSFWAHHLGVSSLYKNKNIDMENEIATNVANNRLDWGGYSMVNFNLGKFRMNNNVLYAGKHYFGFFNDGWQWANSTYYRLTSRLTVGVINNYSQVNPSIDLINFNTSPYYKNNMGEVSYNITSKNRIVFNVAHQYKEDRQLVKKFHFKEDFGRIMIFSQTVKNNLWASGEIGYAQNLLVSPDISGKRYSYRGMIQNDFSILPSLTLGIYGEFMRTSKFSIDNSLKDYMFYGGGLRYHLKKLIDFNLSYRNNYAPDELIIRRDFFNLQANLELGNHKLSIVGTKTFLPNFSEQNNMILSLRYRYLFNIAVAKVKNLGSIKGQITGASNVKKEGVLVQIGSQKYLTDTDGKFVINNLKPDRYAVSLFRSSMTMNDIPAHQGILEVEVKADSTHSLEIPFIKAGMIAGKVNYEKGNNPGLAGDKIEKPTVLVKLFNGEDSHLTLANENGEFTFKEIKPGDWKLQATLMMGEGKFSISQPQRDVTVVAEQAKEVTFVVRPVSRTIRFIDRSIQTGSK